MKSKLVILSLLLAGATAATAQTKETFYSESFKDNIFVSVGVGAQGCVNPDNFDYGFGKAITPLINVSVGKLFNPVWGIRGQVAGAWTTLYSNYGQPADTYIKSKNKHYFTMRADGMFNLSNAIGGYNPDRLFTVSVFAGPGLTFAKAYGDQDKVNALINGSVGLAGQFNINKYLDINIEARGEVSPSPFGNISSAHTDGAVSLTAGVTYTFGGKRFVSCGSQVDQNAINEELNRYRSELSKAQSDLADAKNALANVKPVTKEVVKEVKVPVEVPAKNPAFYDQYQSAEYTVAAITERVIADCNAKGHAVENPEALSIYLKPEDKKAYYTLGGFNGYIEL